MGRKNGKHGGSKPPKQAAEEPALECLKSLRSRVRWRTRDAVVFSRERRVGRKSARHYQRLDDRHARAAKLWGFTWRLPSSLEEETPISGARSDGVRRLAAELRGSVVSHDRALISRPRIPQSARESAYLSLPPYINDREGAEASRSERVRIRWLDADERIGEQGSRRPLSRSNHISATPELLRIAPHSKTGDRVSGTRLATTVPRHNRLIKESAR